MEVGAEVEHDDRMVGDVLVEAFPDDFCLEEKGKLSLEHSRGPELLLGAHPGGPQHSPSLIRLLLVLCV